MKKKPDLRDQLTKRFDKDKLANIVFGAFERHASENEREMVRGKLFMAMALEVERSNNKESEWYLDYCNADAENKELKRKLKIRIPKSAIRNKK